MNEQTALHRVKAEIAGNDVVLFMKGTPRFPQCGFSAAVADVLRQLNVPYRGINVLEDEAIRSAVKEAAKWPTIPQLYIKGLFIGGCDIVRDMYECGELQQILKDSNIACNG